MGDVERAGDEPALVEPARQRLVELASLVLGRMPADEVPAGLRTIARFTPARRLRLGATALAAALDADDGFRQRVADVVEQGSPDLVAAVRAGGPTTAAEPLDLAVIAYLGRPEGWQDTLAAANERWFAEQGSAQPPADTAALEQLRAEMTQLRAQARSEPARLRAAVEEATAQARGEADELRRTLRERGRELRAAQRERDEARAEADELRQRLDRQDALHEAQLRRMRGQLSEAERTATAARQDARITREVDDARLWLLVDTLVQAAAGVRRELSLGTPETRPAEHVAGEVGGTGDARARAVQDPVGLDRLLALPHLHLVVDGYNVTKTGYGELPLEAQRARLLGALGSLAAQTGAEVTAAFDGTADGSARPPATQPAPRGVRLLFSAPGEIADDLIRRLVAAEPAGRPVAVVTSDRAVAVDVGDAGAWTVPSDVLLRRLG